MIYLDHSATTPVAPEVLEAMLPYFGEQYGNPSSLYHLGQRSHQAVENARRRVARLLNCGPREVIFTGCGSESDNLAIRGIAAARRDEGRHLITTAIEHEAVLATMRQLAEHEGYELTILGVDEGGRVDTAELEAALRPDTVLVSVMLANNEVGTIQPLAEIGALLADHPAHLHTDAVQAGGYLALDVDALGVDSLALSAHKFHGPKGAGLMFLRGGTPYRPPLTGGSQEGSRRPGTLNVPLIVGLAAALELAREGRDAKNARLVSLRDRLIAGVLEHCPGARLTGHPTQRLPGHASFVIGAGLEADAMLLALDMAGIAASSGSACHSGRSTPSHVLTAMGIPHLDALSALRLTLGDGTTREEVDRAIETVGEVVARLRAHAPTP